MNKNIFTVDVEEYYQAENLTTSLPAEVISGLPDRVGIGTHKILKLLEATGNKGTFFVLGSVAGKNAKLIREIHDNGHEVASHGYEHTPLYKHNADSFEEDIDRSVKTLSDIVGAKIEGYRATGFSLLGDMPWFFEILTKHGIIYDSSLSVSLFRRYFYGDVKQISEFPVSSMVLGPVRLPLGGGYFRAYPYWLTRYGLRRAGERENMPTVFYMHPWELDPGQPRLKIPPMKSFRHYFNLTTTEAKLKRLLNDFRFTSAKNYLDRHDIKCYI